MTTMPKLTDAQRVLLSKSSQHDAGLAALPKIPRVAAENLIRSLLGKGLLAEIAAPREHAAMAWRQDEDGNRIALRITVTGLRAIGVYPEQDAEAPVAEETADRLPTAGQSIDAGGTGQVPSSGKQVEAPQDEDAPAPEPAQAAPTALDDAAPEEEEDDRPRHERLGIDEALIYGPAEEWQQPAGDAALLEQALAERAPRKLVMAAQRVLAAWDNEANRDGDMIGALYGPMQALRAALAIKPPPDTSTPRAPRPGTKQEAVLALLRRPEGATVAQVCEITLWTKDTVRGFFAGLKKKGISVEAVERVRAVGPNRAGGRGSYTIYRVAEAGRA